MRVTRDERATGDCEREQQIKSCQQLEIMRRVIGDNERKCAREDESRVSNN